MKVFFKNFIGVILATVALLAVSLLLYTAASSLFSIVSSKRESVNTSDVKNQVTVILDAGHGGIDGGAVGVSGSLEKQLNLAIATKVKDLLSAQGYTVVMTRENDELLTLDGVGSQKSNDLRARVKIAESHENAIFVSIHMNRFPDSSVKGITFYFSPNHPDSYRLADSLHTAMLESVQPDNRRPMKEATKSIYILHTVTLPAVLVECGFLSNALEEAMLNDDDYQNTLAEMIFRGVTNYLQSK